MEVLEGVEIGLACGEDEPFVADTGEDDGREASTAFALELQAQAVY